ncbi:hypothetical protein [Streptomyces milbemycinicus]|uniref:hypothetical protein n=1 Tax=Streptomyces milbemycinicus TaxID=476552 RepID=UPI0033CC4F7B
MKYDGNPSDRDVSGRTDLQEFSEKVSGRHLNEIRERLLLEPKARREATIAWSIKIHPFLSATRGIARWTNQHKETVQQIAGPTGGLSDFKFLYTATRGHSSVIEEEREGMELRFNSLAGRSWSPLGADGYRQGSAQYLSEVPIPSTPWTLKILEDGKIQKGNGRILAGIGDMLVEDLILASEEIKKLEDWGTPGSWSHNLLTLLDPANDSWTDEKLGSYAWHLAVLFAGQDILVTSKDLQHLLGIKERMVRYLVAQWEKQSFVVTEKVGRTKVYTLLFHSVLHPDGSMYDGHLGDKTKLYAAMGRDQQERATAARRGTPEGAIAWKAANPRTRQAFLETLPEDADAVWRELVERGDEMEMYEHLMAQVKEVGSVPSTPEVLVDEAAVQPAQESLEVPKPIDREVLAEMRARISGQDERSKFPEALPAPQSVEAEDETEDDRLLCTMCEGDSRIFESVFGRLPNQPKFADRGRCRRPRRVPTTL